MKTQLRGAVEGGEIVSLGPDEDGEERLMFAGDMTAANFREAAEHEENSRVKRFTMNVAQWMEATAPEGARLKELF